MDDMVKAAERNDAKLVSKLVHRVAGTGRKFNNLQPTKDKAGDVFSGPEEVTKAWKEFAEIKFAQDVEDETRSEKFLGAQVAETVGMVPSQRVARQP